MAEMIPQLSSEQLRNILSRAETRFYEACRDQLPAEVVVIYSSNWIYRKRVEDKVHEGEADFTLLFPQSGVLAVKVKGGGAALDACHTQNLKEFPLNAGRMVAFSLGRRFPLNGFSAGTSPRPAKLVCLHRSHRRFVLRECQLLMKGMTQQTNFRQ